MKKSRSACLWICCPLVIIGSVSCRVQSTTTAQPAATDQAQSPSPAVLETDGSTAQATAIDPSTPLILSVDFAERVASGGDPGLGSVQFSDSDGDVFSVQFTLLDGGCMDFEFFAFDPLDAMQSGNRFAGTFLFNQSCKKCPHSADDQILMRVQLYDRSGRESAPVDYAFICE
jgi:hypothetical protein